MAVPRTAAEWEAEQDLDRLAKSYRSRQWHAPLRLFAVACARRVWDEIPAGTCREAVEIAEQFARGLVAKRELFDAGRRARGAVEDAVRVGENRRIYGTLAEARTMVAWACTLPAEQPAIYVTQWVCGVVQLLSSEAALSWGAASFQAEATGGESFTAEQRALTALLREMVGNPFSAAGVIPGAASDRQVS